MKFSNGKNARFLGIALLLFVGQITGTFPAFNVRSASPYAKTIDGYAEAYQAMYLAMYELESELDMSELKIKKSNIMQLYSDVRNNSPELFYLQNKLFYHYNADDEYVTSVEFAYTMSGEELKTARERYDMEVAYISSLVDNAMSEAEIALFVHDYFVSSFSYDNTKTVYDAYGLFATRTGVCQAYSLAYMAVLRECGIETVMATSEEMNHAWNLVKIDDEWYHVDVSHDDPFPERFGTVLHKNFLLSDEEIKKTHYGWDDDRKCRSTLYDDAYWRGVSSQITRMEGSWYYIDPASASLVKSDFEGNEKSSVYTFDEKWYVSRDLESYWNGIFSGCANYQKELYFNTADEILSYSAQTGEIRVLAVNDDVKTDFYGLIIYKNTLEYISADQPDVPCISNFYVFSLDELEPELLKTATPFEDVPRLSKYYAAVTYAYDNGIFKGVKETNFSPKTGISRAMFVTALGRMCGIDTNVYGERVFKDVSVDSWFAPYVEWAAKNGIVEGVGDGCFEPDAVLTREQMYKIFYAFACYLGYPDAETEDVALAFVDKKQISDWACDGVAYCYKNNLIDEEFFSYLKPKKSASRGEAAELIYRFATVFHYVGS